MMASFKKASTSILLVLFGFLLVPKEAYAYIDPATGSYITQIILAVVIGGLFVIKQYLVRIKEFIRNLSSRGKKLE